MSNIKVIIDSRELKIKDYFDTNGLFTDDPVCTYTNLDIGDIHFFINDQLVLIIERKTLSDLVGSIKDGRYKEQKCRLLSNYPCSKIMYLIEGQVDSKVKRQCYNIDIIYGSILNCLLRDKIKILFSKDIPETCNYIKMILKRMRTNTEFFDYTIDNSTVSYENAVKINKKNNMTPELCQLTQLAQIPGMSTTSAKYILDKYISIKGIIKAYELEIEKGGNPDLMLASIDCKSRKLGKVVSKRIYEYIFI